MKRSLSGVLGQANPKFSLEEVFTNRKVLLIPLNKGVIGAESAALLGSLVVGLVWTMALSRADIAPEKRHTISLYIDELQSFMAGVSQDLSEALAEARGLGLAMHLATQYLGQLPPAIRSAVEANCRNKIYFRQSAEDARELAKRIPELAPEDFLLLPRYEIYTTFNVNGRNTGFIRGKTLPPPKATRSAAELKAMSQQKYGEDIETVEGRFFASLKVQPQSKVAEPTKPATDTTLRIGRRKKDE